MDIRPHVFLDSAAAIPLYRQLAESLRTAIHSGALTAGTRLPATRELAGQLGLNRTTISAAYAILEQAGLLEGLVGRGSFVARGESPVRADFDWDAVLTPLESLHAQPVDDTVNFANSRPDEQCFPMAEFRRLSKEVIDGPQAAEILQLGSPYGYAPLRRYLLAENADAGIARPSDDLIITNGCQQALDLLGRILIEDGTPVLVEDPVYHGLLRVLGRAGAHVIPVPVSTEAGLNVNTLETLVAQHRPRLLVITPDFQNPTGTTLNLEQRKRVIAVAQRFGLVIVETNIYRKLRYCGTAQPSLKELDQTGNVISIGSYSKVAFPGLRTGWVIAPRPVIARLAEAKQTSDLHSDQLSQGVLLRFAESGELDRHLAETRRAGAKRLAAALDSCEQHLPSGSRFSQPEGGMNLWVELPAPLVAQDLLNAARECGVSFLPGPYFSSKGGHRRALRLSFGGLSPERITRGIAMLGVAASEQLRARSAAALEPAAALV